MRRIRLIEHYRAILDSSGRFGFNEPNFFTTYTKIYAWGRNDMKTSTNLIGVFCALILSATSAAAVTVNVSITGQLDFIVYDNVPETATTLAEGDSFTYSFDVDLNQMPGPGQSRVTRAGEISKRSLSYQTGAASLIFDTGPSFDLGPQRINVQATEMSPSFPRNRYYSDVSVTTDSSIFPNLIVDIFGEAGRDTAPYTRRLTDAVAGFNDLDTTFSEMLIATSILGAADDACDGGFCLVLLDNIAGTITGALPIDPTVTPVPVPAPFLMLGAAMLGLIRFGRQVKA